MPSFKLFIATFALFLLHNETNAESIDEWVSPCPSLFFYEDNNNNEDRWFRIITLLSDTDLDGIWLRIIFDRPPLSLLNWFGEIHPCFNIKEPLIRNSTYRLKAHVSKKIRIGVQYNPNEPPPKLVSFQLNAKQKCPVEGVGMEATVSLVSNNHGGGGAGHPDGTSPGIGGVEEEDMFISDFASFLRPNKRPTSNNKDLNDVCGIVIIPRQLTTPYQAREGEFPWHAALYHSNGIDLTYICGGSLISKNHVITVAHCVTKRKSQDALNPNNLNVYLGKFYLKHFTSPGFQVREVSKIIPHSQYNAQSYMNDIALVKFTEPADITDYVRPVCLWQESHDLSSVLDKQGNVVGWGFDARGEVSETIIKAQMVVDSQGICLSSNSTLNSLLTANTYCASYINGTSVCTSDYGGGMVFERPGSKRNSLRGLVTVIIAPENEFKCNVSNHIVFTDVAKYLEWIKESMML